MALISCPNCGQEVSEKATKCVYCGSELNNGLIFEKTCMECGSKLSTGVTECPVCGCPTEEEKTDNPQKVELTKVKLTIDEKKKRIIMIAIAVLSLIIIGSCVGIVVKNNIDKKDAQNEAQEESKKYKSDLKEAIEKLLEGAAEAESAVNLIKNVWNNKIEQNYDDPETDKYTIGTANFDEAIKKLFDDAEFQSKISSIESNQETVQGIMKTLTNPSNENREAYETLKEMYVAYNKVVDCAVNPTGSLTTYSQTFNEARTEFLNCYKEMELYIK